MPNIITLKDNASPVFKLINYPDGQKSVKLHYESLNVKEDVVINCSIKNIEELIILVNLVETLHDCDFYISNIYFYYLFGMRSDRAFSKGETNYFKKIIVPIINRMQIKNVWFFSPHSHLSMWAINRSGVFIPNQLDDYFKKSLSKIFPKILNNNSMILAGDESFYYNHNLWINGYLDNYFKKSRIAQDKIEVHLTEPVSHFEKILIMDDMCDGGGTFIAEAKYLREKGFKGELSLYVSHGLFTKPIPSLIPYFNQIFCTNSYQDIDHPAVTQIKVI